MAQRTCPRCSTSKAAADFYRNVSRADGLSTYCKSCTREVRQERYRDTIRAQQQRWREANPDRVAEYDRRYRQANPEKIRAKAARQRAENPDKVRAYVRAADANKRAKRHGCVGTITAAQIASRWDYYGNCCWMCGGPAEVTDHVKPLAKGGPNIPANVRPACQDCNDRKRDAWPLQEVHLAGTATRREGARRPAA